MARPSNGKTPDGVRRTNAARSAAIRRLIDKYPSEWKELYAEEASLRGVVVRNGEARHRIVQLETQLRELRAQQPSEQEAHDLTEQGSGEDSETDGQSRLSS